jgi:hypothetical protein
MERPARDLGAEAGASIDVLPADLIESPELAGAAA